MAIMTIKAIAYYATMLLTMIEIRAILTLQKIFEILLSLHDIWKKSNGELLHPYLQFPLSHLTVLRSFFFFNIIRHIIHLTIPAIKTCELCSSSLLCFLKYDQ